MLLLYVYLRNKPVHPLLNEVRARDHSLDLQSSPFAFDDVGHTQFIVVFDFVHWAPHPIFEFSSLKKKKKKKKKTLSMISLAKSKIPLT